MASICSVTFIDASSAPMPAPTRPLTTRPVMIGPITWITEYTRVVGKHRLGAESAQAVTGFHRDHNADRGACQCNQRQRLRSNLVELPNQLAPLIRRRHCGPQNLPGKDAQARRTTRRTRWPSRRHNPVPMAGTQFVAPQRRMDACNDSVSAVAHLFGPSTGEPCALFRCIRESREWGPL